MFTGIVKELGKVTRVDTAGNLYKLAVSSRDVFKETGIGESVCVNGACLTLTGKKDGILLFDVMAETVRKTTLADLKSGDIVNLEGSLRAGGSIGGHFVLGHVDCVGTVLGIVKKGEEFVLEIGFPVDFDRFVVEKGSVAIDGVSLTIGQVCRGSFKAYLIPHTLKVTVLGNRRPQAAVNLEFDIIGKYVAKLAGKNMPGITEDFLKANGF